MKATTRAKDKDDDADHHEDQNRHGEECADLVRFLTIGRAEWRVCQGDWEDLGEDSNEGDECNEEVPAAESWEEGGKGAGPRWYEDGIFRLCRADEEAAVRFHFSEI